MATWINQIKKNYGGTVGDYGAFTFDQQVKADGTTFGELTFDDITANTWTEQNKNTSSWNNQQPSDFQAGATFGNAIFGESQFGEDEDKVERTWTNQSKN